jgi:molybdate transport system substrate-binding protein
VVAFHFGASSRLARQIEAGAPADLFFSADAAWMDYLAQRGRLAPGSRVDLLRNALVVVVPRDARWVPTGPADLAAPEMSRLALAGEAVPAGRYARTALQTSGVWPTVQARVVVGDDVRAALAWAARGEASAAVVYATDARVEPRVRVAFAFASESHPTIVYPAAVMAASRRPAEARRFLAFCQGPEARAIFAAQGFTMVGAVAP